MTTCRLILIVLVCLWLSSKTSGAQVDYDAPPAESGNYSSRSARDLPRFSPPGRDYDDALMPPPAFLGYELGTRFTPHHQIIQYLELLSRSSSKMAFFEYGRTYQGRELVYLAISSETNIENLERLRAENLRLADPETTIEDKYYSEAPVIVWLSYGVHGNEACSPEAALAVAYHLAADMSEDTRRLLKHTVVVIDPLLNPDGHERYVQSFASRMGSQPDENAQGWEHSEPWPSGRFNHYLFDLNRDWTWLIQVESRHRIKAYLSWMPQVHIDYHEMGANATYFFFPPKKPINPNYPLQMEERWWRIYGMSNAEAFDEHGWSYFAEEMFDAFYPGYGESLPTYYGAIGMTYEQGGSRTGGLIVRRRDHTLLSLAARIEHHFVTSLTTIATADKHRVEQLKDFRGFFEDGLNGAREEKVHSYIIPAGTDPMRTSDLIGLLLSLGIRVDVSTEEFSPGTVQSHVGSRIEKKKFPEGTYIVPIKQPLRRLVHTLLDPETELPDTSLYDITAWSLPFAYGVDVYAARSKLGVPVLPLEAKPEVEGKLIGDNPRFGYIIPWETNGAARALTALLDAGCHVRFAGKSFTLNNRDFPPGTLILPRIHNSDTLDTFIKRLARRHGLSVYAAKSGYTEKGIDLGSIDVKRIKPGRVAIVGGEGASPTSFGSLWFLLDRAYGVPHTIIELDRLKQTDLSLFAVIVFPSDQTWEGNGEGYASRIDSTTLASLQQWISNGGIFIGLGGGAAYASGSHAKLCPIELKKKEKKSEGFTTVKKREDDRIRNRVAGSIVKIRLDTGHPIAFGYPLDAAIIKTTNNVFASCDKCNTVGFFPESARLSGYISEENQAFLTNTPCLVQYKAGKGHVILFLEDPNFRMFWHGLNRLLLNTIFFMPAY